jgi:hypothetical protein
VLEDEIAAEEGDERQYVRFILVEWTGEQWRAMDSETRYPAHIVYEMQSGFQLAGDWLLKVCQLHKGRFHYTGDHV